MVSLLTALVIQGNETEIHPYLDKTSQKWGYEVSRMERGNYRQLVSCSPIYDSEDVAKKKGEGLVKQVRELDLSPKRQELGTLISDSGKAVQKVIGTRNPQ
jgi:hypothetical protein